MSQLLRLPDANPRDPATVSWLQTRPGELSAIARHWFGVARACGDDGREALHDGQATACVQDAAFAYVNVFTAHVNKLRPGEDVAFLARS